MDGEGPNCLVLPVITISFITLMYMLLLSYMHAHKYINVMKEMNE